MGTYLMGIVGPRHVDEAEIALLLFAVLCVLLAYIVDQETKEPARRWCDAGRSDRRRGDDLRKKKPPEKHVCFRCGLVKEQSPRNAAATMFRRDDGTWVCAPCVDAVCRDLEEKYRRIAAEASFSRCL